jgi:hypothetical protein
VIVVSSHSDYRDLHLSLSTIRRLLAAFLLLPTLCYAQTADWQALAAGLDLRVFKAADAAPAGDSTITILRVDPKTWDMRLYAVSQTGDRPLSAHEWSDKHQLVAVINAGMFNADVRTHTGYMKVDGRYNNHGRNQYQSIAAFRPTEAGLDDFHMFDLDSNRIDSMTRGYKDVVQNLRLIDRAGNNRWEPQDKKWSEAALGEDRQGRALFIFSRSPYSMNTLNRILLSLPIELVCAQHLEGGAEAQLYFHVGDVEQELVGGYESSFSEFDDNNHAWPIPNVIGIRPIR